MIEIEFDSGAANVETGETLAAKIVAGAGTLDLERQRIISGFASTLRQFPVSIQTLPLSFPAKCYVRIREFLFQFAAAGESGLVAFYGLSLVSPEILTRISLSYESLTPPQSIYLCSQLWRIVAGHICFEISHFAPSEIRLPDKVKELEAAQIGFEKVSDMQF